MKRICILDSRERIDLDFDKQMNNLIQHLEDDKQVDWFLLNKMDIKYCVGCWDCWLKTPGLCRFKDNHREVLRSFVNADQVVFICELSVGFINSLLKKTMDRLIPIVLPYIREFHNESHHYPRYDLNPKIKIIVIDNETTEAEISLVKDYFLRVALNFDSEVKSFSLYNKLGDINDELFNI
jgi:multimeric flavodoxin WrbA